MRLWKDIKREDQQMKHDCKLVLGNGGRIRFWEDKWNRGNPLRTLFPTLYAITASKGKMIRKVWESSRGKEVWNLRFFRPFNDWELDEAQRLISSISSSNVRQREENKILWDHQTIMIMLCWKASFKFFEVQTVVDHARATYILVVGNKLANLLVRQLTNNHQWYHDIVIIQIIVGFLLSDLIFIVSFYCKPSKENKQIMEVLDSHLCLLNRSVFLKT